jgi:hypothetical protein
MVMTLLVGTVALARVSASLLETSPCEFGETYQLAAVHCTLSFTNHEDQPVQVISAAGVRATDSITPSTATIAPNSTAYFDAVSDVRNELGRAEHWFYVTTDNKREAKRFSKADGFVISILDDPQPEADFGVVELRGGLPDAKTVSVSSRDESAFRLKSILKVPPYIDASLDESGHSVRVSLKADAPWGLLDEFITLETSSAKQPSVGLRIKADIHGEVVPSSNPYALGVMRQGQENEALIRIVDRSGKDFKVGKIDFEQLAANADLLSCQPTASGCRLLRLRLTDDQAAGVINGRVLLDLPDFKKRLPITVQGLLLKHDTKIKELSSASEQKGPVSKAESKPLDLGSALRQVTKKINAAPPGHGPLLKWTVAHEETIYGYVVYRSESEQGPYVRANNDLIRIEGDDDSGSTYQWRDESAESGKTYWYYIGLVHNNGKREDLSSPQKIVAK